MPYMFEGLPDAGHLEVVSIQNVAQDFNSLFLQLLYDLKKGENSVVMLCMQHIESLFRVLALSFKLLCLSAYLLLDDCCPKLG